MKITEEKKAIMLTALGALNVHLRSLPFGNDQNASELQIKLNQCIEFAKEIQGYEVKKDK